MAYTTINKSTDYFNTKLYTGDGTSPRSITGVGFQPDFLWIKNRSGGTPYEHRLMDAVRGSNKVLHSSNTGAENSEEYYTVSSFDSDGWTGRNGTGTNQVITGGNDNGYNFVAWNWLASNTTASNTDGSITSTVSANTTAGFSVGTYSGNSTTGATVGHGLGSAPSMVIVKKRNATGDWYIYHAGIGATAFIKLNETGASATNTLWNDTAPTSSVFSMDSNSAVNGSSDNYVFYAFAEKKGYSKFGSYTGNGNVDGTFVYTGFKPAWVMIKDITSGTYKSWSIFDTTRQTFNVNAGKTLYANRNYEEGKRGQGDASTTIPAIDMLSNGFKCRVLNDEVNTTSTYIYMAIGQSLVGSNNVPCTAR